MECINPRGSPFPWLPQSIQIFDNPRCTHPARANQSDQHDFTLGLILVEECAESAEKARTWVENVDRERRDFVRRYCRRDVADPHLYDLVVNADRIGPAGVVQLIIAALRQKGLCE